MKHLGIFCGYSNRMTDYLGKCPTYMGRVIDEKLYNKPVPRSVYCTRKENVREKVHTPSLFDFE